MTRSTATVAMIVYGSILVIQSTYINSFPVYSSMNAMAVMFIAPPRGVPAPPTCEPHAMAQSIGVAASHFLISVYPAATSMETAIGVRIATTTTFGIILERTMAARSHTVIWDFMEGPIRESAFKDILLSSPISLQGAVKRQDPKIRIILLEAYWEITSSMGTMLKSALITPGKSAVTVISTGLATHQ